MDIEKKLLEFIGKEMLENKFQLDKNNLLFSSRLLDSFSLVELMGFIEEEFKVRIKPNEIRMENLDSVAHIKLYVESKLKDH